MVEFVKNIKCAPLHIGFTAIKQNPMNAIFNVKSTYGMMLQFKSWS